MQVGMLNIIFVCVLMSAVVAQKHRGCTDVRLQDDELLQRVVTEFNSALVFSPSELKMAYCIRDPLRTGMPHLAT